MLNRRDFLKMIGMFSVILTPLHKLVIKTSSGAYGGSLSDGELYEGFLLLDQDSPIPFFVQEAPCPILGQIDESEADASELAPYTGNVLWFDNIDSLKNNIDFHIFIPGTLPHKMIFLQGYVLRFAGTGDVWEARLDFGFEDTREPRISLSARPIFARPYPVWPVLTYPSKKANEVILDEEFVVKKPEKVGFTPTRGIMLPTDEGYTLQWIKKDVLYTMFMEYAGWHDNAYIVGKSLLEN